MPYIGLQIRVREFESLRRLNTYIDFMCSNVQKFSAFRIGVGIDPYYRRRP